MTNPRLMYAVTLAGALLGAALQPVDAAPPLSSFAAMDADGDGRVTTAEHSAAATRMFREMDVDRDGKVTVAEMEGAQDRITGQAKGAGMAAAGKLKVVDRNRDGVLSAAEHSSGSSAMFQAMDHNRDGALDRKEFDAGHARLAK